MTWFNFISNLAFHGFAALLFADAIADAYFIATRGAYYELGQRRREASQLERKLLAKAGAQYARRRKSAMQARTILLVVVVLSYFSFGGMR